MFLLDDILLAPAKGLLAVFKAVQEQAEREMQNDQGRLRQELLRLQRSRTGDEAQREALEAALLASLVSNRRRAQP